MFTTAPHAVELSNPLVYLAALKLLARKPARPANRYAINKNGTYFHASKKFLENKILAIGLENNIKPEQANTFITLK